MQALSAPSRPVVYDVTRLVTRALNPTPNGIDRVDFALARHFLSGEGDHAALICTALGPRLASAADAYRTIVDIETYWNEYIAPARDEVYESLVAALDGGPRAARGALRVKRSGLDSIAANWRAMRNWALRLGRPIGEVPAGAIYVNASQFLLDKAWFLRWLGDRPDVKPCFFVHDLLPIETPEFFRPGEPPKHLAAMRNVSRLAAGAIVGSNTVARRLRAFAARNGREDLPLCVASLPISPVFEARRPVDARLEGRRYFVVCGTIEPRKNHLTLLNVWRELAWRFGPATPKLVVIGKRGWHNENVLDLLERCEALRPHVIEAAGLSTPALRNLFAGARAVLTPSFDEGFGLPVAEAAAAGAPVIASDIEVFREIGGDALDYIDPLDGLGWRDAIIDYAGPGSKRRADALARAGTIRRDDGASFFAKADAFLAGL
ncbi:MAG: glycosyltransferase family 1 protein [Methylocystaceae bacterium]|nr:MAG: glycosyltransferase family 1 protein [Methylocystaceae bacterium]